MNNKYKMSPDKSYVEIFFSDGSFFIIDTCDFDEISKHSWYKGKRGYPICNTSRKSETGQKKVPVHKLILGNISELEVDHISGDKMDNRRKNLRVCTHQQNMFNQNKRKTNTTGYIGVCLHKCGRYEAYINVGGVKKYLGLFDTATDAAKARDQAAMIWFGDYARLNMEPEAS